MYLCAGCALLGLAAYVICVKAGKKKDAGVYFLILALSGVFGVLAALSGDERETAQEEEILRPQPGEGDVQKDYLLDAEGLFLQEPYRVVVENRHLTKRELEELFLQATDELEQTFLGENRSLDHISKNVVPVDSVLEGRVFVSWSFDSYEEVNLAGELQTEALAAEGSLVEVTATLLYEQVEAVHSFTMMVYPPEKSAREQFFDALSDALAAQNAGTDETLSLPTEAAGYRLHWQRKRKSGQYTMLLLGLCACAATAVGKKRDAKKAGQKREELLLAQYPQVLSELSLLLGAGMTVSHAWERIVLSYESRLASQGKGACASPAYEEMRITYHQMKDGVGERSAYEQFGQRLNLQVYRKFATLLVQNLRKGTAGLGRLLDREVQEAFEARESLVKKRGEELETKLLLPMMLMLGLVIVIIMIPAIASFQL